MLDSTTPATYCSVCGEKFSTPQEAAACQHDAPEKFATATWVINDITSIAPSLSPDDAANFLALNEDNIRDLMVERGWNAILDLLAQEGIDASGDFPS